MVEGKLRPCDFCSKSFEPRSGRQAHRFCSNTCRKAYVLKHQRKLNPRLNLPTGTVGALQELRVATDLLVRGFHVFRAMSPASPCDLVILKDGQTIRVEVRTAYRGWHNQVHYPKKNIRADLLALCLPEKICYERLTDIAPNLPAEVTRFALR